MLHVEQALSIILENVKTLETEDKALLEALGQAASEDIPAPIDVPQWDSSGMDGFAVRAEDIRSAAPQKPVRLEVIETVTAGVLPRKPVTATTAVRIMTGAPVPAGADCIIPFEDARQESVKDQANGADFREVFILHPEKSGTNIKSAGEQIRRGSMLVKQGARLGPAETGLLAAVGYTRVKVIRRPRVAIFSTGDELTVPGQPLLPPHIYNGSSLSIAAQAMSSGCLPAITGITADNKSSILTQIRNSLEADAIISTGGVSAGDHDLVREVLSEYGQVLFHQVKMTPGKSFTFARVNSGQGDRGKVPFFALSGSPTASMVNFEVLVRPALFKMSGNDSPPHRLIEALLDNALENRNPLRHFVWVKIEACSGEYHAVPTANLNQGVLTSIALANGLAIIPESKRRIEKGEKIQVMLLDWR